MYELKTLSKNDPQFFEYLMGTFSKEKRALPIQSLNVLSESEAITFQILPIQEIQTPSFLLKWAQILKAYNLIYVLFPLFILIANNVLNDRRMDLDLVVLSLLGTLFLALSFNLRNDVKDHVSGLDRVHQESGSQAIQKGWTTAAQANQLSNIFILLGVVFGSVAVLVYPQLLIIVGVLALLGVVGTHHYKSGLKYRIWTELSVFLLLGPLLAVGFQTATTSTFQLETVLIGSIFGLFSVFQVHIKNFSALMLNDKAGFVNTIHLLGFEKAKKFLFYWWLVLISMLNFVHILDSSSLWSWIFMMISFIFSILFLQDLKKLQSPVSSFQKSFLKKIKVMSLFLMTLWILETVSYLLVMDLGN